MFTRLFVLLISGLLYCTSFTYSQLLINEFQPNPTEDEPEWIELFNSSSTAIVDGTILLHDTRTVITIEHLQVAGYGYAVLTTDSTLLHNQKLLPTATPVYEVKIPTLNNSTDVIVIRDKDSILLDSVYYSVKWVKRGISFERKLYDRPALYPTNLSACTARDSSTCGYTNSVSPWKNDLSIVDCTYDKLSNVYTISARNESLETIIQPTVILFIDTSSIFGTEVLSECAILEADSLTAGDTIVLNVESDRIYQLVRKYGSMRSVAVCRALGDSRTQNDTLRTSLFLSYPIFSVRVNEIMYEPRTGEAEFIELYNSTDYPIPLQGWKLHDKPTTADADTLHLGGRIEPHRYAVLAWDSVFFEQYPSLQSTEHTFIAPSSMSLNSDGDLIVLRDPNGVIMDSLAYSPQWHDKSLSIRKGVSLEKILPTLPSAQSSSWSSCGTLVQGATPGFQNSLMLTSPSSSRVTATPNPFSPSDVSDGFTIISYTLEYPSSTVTAGIFSVDGVLVRTLLNTTYTAGVGAVVWNGRDDTNTLLPPGGYVVVIEATDSATGSIVQTKHLIAIARK